MTNFKKTTEAGYLIDETGHVVINTDDRDLRRYRTAINQVSEVKDLRDELKEVKELLATLLKR